VRYVAQRFQHASLWGGAAREESGAMTRRTPKLRAKRGDIFGASTPSRSGDGKLPA
jgi:hypothetical protein